jgi:hypothetical protein
MIQKIKNTTTNAINITKEQFDKTFDFAKIQNQKLKDKIDYKISEKALLNLKAELAMRHKTTDDFNDEELETMLEAQRQKIIDDLKTNSLVGALAILGLDFLI